MCAYKGSARIYLGPQYPQIHAQNQQNLQECFPSPHSVFGLASS